MLYSMEKIKKDKKGFTLIELIVVIAILAILAAVLVPRFMVFTDSAKISRLVSDCKTVNKAISAYMIEKGSAPSQTAGTAGSGSLIPDYLPTAPANLGSISSDGSFSIGMDTTTLLSAFCDTYGNVVIVKNGSGAVASDLNGTEGALQVSGGGTIVYLSTKH